MRKSSVFIILAVFLISIVVISYIGTNPSFYGPVEPTTHIEFLDTRFVPHPVDGVLILRCDFKDEEFYDPESKVFRYRLTWRVHPDNATRKEVRFFYAKIDGFSINDSGLVEIAAYDPDTGTGAGEGTYTIEIAAADRPNNRVQIKLMLL